MRPKSQIETVINDLVALYDSPATPTHKDYYAKLALLELCGWLESTLDDIVKNYSDNNLSDERNREIVDTQVIGKTYGCDYKEHFRPMIIKLIGLKNIETLETTLRNNGVLQILVSQLNSLWALRKRAAHTSIAGVTINYQAPSSMRTYLNSLYPILTQVEQELSNF